jgi:asparagine synthetase B (glutamine-hydrolysing)
MKETVQFFHELARRHRQLASELHNEEVIRDLLRLAEECDAKADELTRHLATERGGWPRSRRALGNRN